MSYKNPQAGYKKPQYESWQQFLEENQKMLCNAPGCHHKRWRVSGYCRHHSSKNNNYGHPLSEPLKLSNIEIERLLAERVIKLNESHGGIQFGLTVCKEILEGTVDDPSFQSRVGWLTNTEKAQEVTPLQLLSTLVALYVAYEYGRIVRDDRHLTYMLGHAVILLCESGSTGRSIYGSLRKQMGEHIQQRLGALLVKLKRGVIERERKEEAFKADFNKPLQLF